MGRGGNEEIAAARSRAQRLGYPNVRAAVAALADVGLSGWQIAALPGVTQQAVNYHRRKLGAVAAEQLTCNACPLVAQCRRRVRLGRPVACEKRLPWESGRMTAWVQRRVAVRDV